jgi:hypothetical protein
LVDHYAHGWRVPSLRVAGIPSLRPRGSVKSFSRKARRTTSSIIVRGIIPVLCGYSGSSKNRPVPIPPNKRTSGSISVSGGTPLVEPADREKAPVKIRRS